MHGMVLVQFCSFAEEKIGPGGWDRVLARAGLGDQRFSKDESYPDEMLLKLVAAARELSRTPSTELLEGFGEYLVPGLAHLYRAEIVPEWRALDVIEHTERAIHSVVRRQSPGATPPPLRATRIGRDEVRVSYTSARRLCAVARGICRGLGRHYGEKLVIEEPSCMLRGDRTCEIVVRRVSGPADPATPK